MLAVTSEFSSPKKELKNNLDKLCLQPLKLDKFAKKLLILAKTHLGNRAYEEALLLSNVTLLLIPNTPGAFAIRAIAYRELGNLEKALEDVEWVCAKNPLSVNALIIRADLYHQLAKKEKAIADLTAASRLDPDDKRLPVLYRSFIQSDK